MKGKEVTIITSAGARLSKVIRTKAWITRPERLSPSPMEIVIS
jgi:hypothetical protein